MPKIRQKIQVGEFEVIILNYEAQEKIIVTVVDKNRKVVGSLRISNDTGWMENWKSDLPISLN